MSDELRSRLEAVIAYWRTCSHGDPPCIYDCRVCHVLDDLEAALREPSPRPERASTHIGKAFLDAWDRAAAPEGS
jgi:hypothetical protein